MRNVVGTLLTATGEAAVGKKITFVLVTAAGEPTSSFIASTYERVYGSFSVITDATGSFSISLVENPLLIDETYYYVQTNITGDVPFISGLIEGATDLDWTELKANGSPVVPSDIPTLQTFLDASEAAATRSEAALANIIATYPALPSLALDNITALLAVTGMVDTQVADVSGYTSLHDGGGGLFTYDVAVDKVTANAVTIFDPTVSLALQGTGTGLGCWVRDYTGEVSLDWSEAIGDGTNDDTAGYQAARDVSSNVEFTKDKQYNIDLFNTDGSAIVASGLGNTYWNKDVLPYDDFIKNRAENFANQIWSPGRLKGIFLGNSIQAGTGTSAAGFVLSSQMQFRLRDYTNIGAYADWLTYNYAIGSATSVLNMITLASNDTDFTMNANVDLADYSVVLTLRNDTTLLTVSESAIAIEATLAELTAKGKPVFFIIDPPKLDLATGEILDTDATWTKYYRNAIAMCNKYGASIIDAWAYFKALKEDYGIDLRHFMSDTVHPNDYGHAIIGDMLFECFFAKSDTVGTLKVDSNSDFNFSYYDFTPTAGVTTLTTTALVAKTARKSILGEANTAYYEVPTSSSITFTSSQLATGFVLEHFDCSATVTVAYGGVNVVTGLNLASSTIGGFQNLVQMFSSYTRYGIPTTLTITVTAGTLRLTGVAFTSGMHLFLKDYLGALKTGTWTTGTLTSGNNAMVASIVGDKIGFYVTGEYMFFKYAFGTRYGKFNIYENGTLLQTIDCYNSGTTESYTFLDLQFSTGLKYIEIEVETKNAASTSNEIKIGGFQNSTRAPIKNNVIHTDVTGEYTYRGDPINVLIGSGLAIKDGTTIKATSGEICVLQ